MTGQEVKKLFAGLHGSEAMHWTEEDEDEWRREETEAARSQWWKSVAADHGHSFVENRWADLIMPCGAGGILTHAQWERLKARIDEFYAIAGPDEIALYNEESATHQKVWRQWVEQRTRYRKEHPEWRCGIYLLRAKGGRYKIGRSVNVFTRYVSHCREQGEQLELVHVIPVAAERHVEAERFFHEHFASKRLGGEWFELTLSDVQWFREWQAFRPQEALNG